ncbi:hypothetical protein [Desulfopila aestuarii]|uniref:Uncharacterized protein n=1 Tax=Desulfopila aestuarii DSM 18488 TaxID=1121416 RepID=A0A1M7YC01_9BACT|nr:hypothetical protein [Desulfopila aestuarii]SHO50106.1 hypothetical protein SAMN02745220_03255 [Desulfopila aestuarii DSM 18488]
MKKKRTIIITVSSLFILALILLLTGGIELYIGPRYKYDRQFKTVEKGKGFIPSNFYLVNNSSNTPLIPILLHIVHSKLPKSLNISKYDITYLKSHKGFSKFKINELSIHYDNGRVVKLIRKEQPESQRVFQISENWQDAIIIPNAVNEKSSFKYHIEGVSFSEEGSLYPFIYEMKFKYSYGFRISTRFMRWASV